VARPGAPLLELSTAGRLPGSPTAPVTRPAGRWARGIPRAAAGPNDAAPVAERPQPAEDPSRWHRRPRSATATSPPGVEADGPRHARGRDRQERRRAHRRRVGVADLADGVVGCRRRPRPVGAGRDDRSGPGQQWSRSAVVPVSSGPGQQWSRSARTTAGPARVGPPPTSWHTCPSTTRPSTRSPGAGRPVSFATSGGRLPRPPSRPPDDARRTSVADGDLDGAGIAAVTDRSGSSMEAPATASSTWRCSRRQPGGAGAGGARSAASSAPRTDAFDRRPAEAEGVRIPPTRRRRRALAAPAGPAGRYRRRRSGPRRNRPRRPASAPRGRGRPAAGHRPRPRRPVTAAPVRPPTPPLWRPDGTGRPRTTLVEASLGIPIRTAAG
jgi:hypothetical protein